MRENEEDKVQLDMKLMAKPKKELPVAGPSTSVFKVPKDKSKIKKKDGEDGDDSKKRKKSALEEIIEEEKKAKKMAKKEEDSSNTDKHVKKYWLKKDIVVKIVTKSLGDKYYKQKAVVREVVDKYGAVLTVLSNGAKVKLDQDHLETVIPGLGRPVLVVNGRYRGEEAVLENIDVDKFCAVVRLKEDGKEATLPYEHFSKLHFEDK